MSTSLKRVALFATLVLVTVACGGTAPEDGRQDQATGGGSESGPVTISIAENAVRGGKNENTANYLLDYAIPAFEKKMADDGRDVTVKFIESGIDDEDYKSRLALDLSAEKGADVIGFDGFWLSEFVTAGYLEPLTDVVGDEVDGWEGWEQMPEAVQSSMVIDDQRYGIPVGTDGRVLFFRKDVFADAGLDENWQPASWDDIVSTARAIKKHDSGITPLQINAGVSMGEATTLQGFVPILLGTGAELHDGEQWLGDTPELREALEFYDTVYGEGLGDAQLQQRADGRDRSFQEFSEGKIAILIESDYLWRGVINPGEGLFPMDDRNELVGYAKIPAKEPGAGIRGQDFVSASGGTARVLNPNTEHPQEAWEFLSFLGSEEALLEFVQIEPRITAREDVNATDAVTQDPILQYISEEVLPITWYRPGFEEYPQVSEAIQRMVENLVAGRGDVAGVASEYESTLIGIVGEENVRGD